MLKLIFLVTLASTFLFALSVALPFSSQDGVTELTSKTFDKFLNTHKPVFVMFYAPWCGHCKAAHPEWVKFGKNSKGVVKVAAVNGDNERELAARFNIQGFPTIKYFKMGGKDVKKLALDYQGMRTASSFMRGAMDAIDSRSVKTIKKVADISTLAATAKTGKIVVLFSNKSKIPPMFSVLSASPALQGVVFGFVSHKDEGIVRHFMVSSFPKILMLDATVVPIPSSDDKVNSSISGVTPYTGITKYEPIAKFVQEQVRGISIDSPDISLDEVIEEQLKKIEKATPKVRKPSFPIAPVELTAEGFEDFCSGKQKMKQFPPLCVVNVGGAMELAEIHAQFAQESILFFYTDSAHFKKVLKGLGENEGMTLFLRTSKKDKVKYTLLPEGGVMIEYLSKILEGSVQMKKEKAFPKIVD